MIRTTLIQCAKRTELFEASAKAPLVREFMTIAVAQRHSTVTPNFRHLNNLTDAGSVMGTPMYMAPEQACGDLHKIGRHTDVYALGGILYELLTGQAAFRPSSIKNLHAQILNAVPTPPRRINASIPVELEATCLKCLDKKISGRFSSAGALASELGEYLQNESEHSHDLASHHSSSFLEKGHPESDSNQRATQETSVRPRPWWPFGKQST